MCAEWVGRWPTKSYIFAHAAVAKPHVVTFGNARRCSATHICDLADEPSRRRSVCRSRETVAKRKFSVKIVGSIARNARFEGLFYEIWRKPRTKRSFWKLFL